MVLKFEFDNSYFSLDFTATVLTNISYASVELPLLFFLTACVTFSWMSAR